MVFPVPGKSVETKFHARGKHWSCSKITGKGGLHTGVDIPGPVGTMVVAARAGVTRHVKFGKAFGKHQLVVVCPDGTEDFYAHMSDRVPASRQVRAGEKVGAVGKEGGATGPHLHFERHSTNGVSWSCAIPVNPSASLKDTSGGSPPGMRGGGKIRSGQVFLSKLKFGQLDSDSVRRLQKALNAHREAGDPKLTVTGNYLVDTDAAVRRCQKRHGMGTDPAKKSFVGKKQATHLFGTGQHVIVP